jgi:pyrimidine deaminase RibD-like protein
MVETDLTFMKRALAIARLGDGLVSPNPMVGAILVKDGLIVGEGHHRYDRLKHAESHAIEMAGDQSRGATLYCSLEPCCHHGRTSPCTDAVIAAGILRAIVAIKDPNPLVNGRGIEQLRAAGIEVEVGLFEEEAARLNECYFKFITGGGPFVHGIIEYPGSSESARWIPSSEFLESVAGYDSLVMGSRVDLNRMFLEARLKRDRHRAFVVAGSADDLDKYGELHGDIDNEKLTFVRLPNRKGLRLADAPLVGRAALADDSDLDSTLELLGHMRVISVVMAPGVFDPRVPRNFERLDKLTLAVPVAEAGARAEVSISRLAVGDLEFDLEEMSLSEAKNYCEFTGYPQLRGVA